MRNYGIENISAFDETERYHIRTLYKELQNLQGQERSGSTLGKEKSDKLDALIWVFKLLDEISVEEE